MNYDAFMEPISWFLTGMEKHSDEKRDDLRGDSFSFFAAMNHHMSRFQGSSLLVAMNELSNHDHSRFMTRTNGNVGRVGYAGPEAAEKYINKGIMKEAVVIQMTWPGAPTLYYGDEAGVCGWTDPDNRRTYPWGKEDTELIDFHRAAIKIHKENKALRTGGFKAIFGEYNAIGYGRMLEENVIAVAINNDGVEREFKMPVWQLGITDEDVLERLIVSNRESFSIEPKEYYVETGFVTIKMEPFSGAILRKKI